MRLVKWNKGKWHGLSNYVNETYCGKVVPKEKEECNTKYKDNVPGGLDSICQKCFDV